MIISENTPVSFNDPLPDAVDYLIIGGGVIGVSIAYFLAKQNKKVLLCEKGRIAGEQSSRNWGWLRQQGRHTSELSIMKESLAIWKGLAAEIGEDVGFTQGGCLYLAENAAEMAEYAAWKDEVATTHQLDTRLFSKSQVNLMLNDPNGNWAGAMCTPSDGRAEPFIAVPKIAKAAQRLGAKIIENCAVRTVERSAGIITQVRTELGAVSVGKVVCAAGAWSSLFMGNMGVRLPQLTVRGCVARTKAVDNFYNGNAVSSKIAFRRRQDGGYTIALGDEFDHTLVPDSFRYLPKFFPLFKESLGHFSVNLNHEFFMEINKRRVWTGDDKTIFEKRRVLNPQANPKMLKRMLKYLKAYVPQLGDVEFAESWAGMIETSPDVLPIISEIDGDPGFFVVTGLSGHGFGIGPGVGRVVADLMQGKPVGHDLTPFKLSRFYDGSPIIPGPSL